MNYFAVCTKKCTFADKNKKQKQMKIQDHRYEIWLQKPGELGDLPNR